MTIAEAFIAEMAFLQRRCKYLADGPDDRWKTLEELLRDEVGDCEDFTNAALEGACRRLGNILTEPVGMIIGDAPGRHAWGGIGLNRLWVEPTPDYPLLVGVPSQFERVPLWYRRFEPGLGFTDKAAYIDMAGGERS